MQIVEDAWEALEKYGFCVVTFIGQTSHPSFKEELELLNEALSIKTRLSVYRLAWAREIMVEVVARQEANDDAPEYGWKALFILKKVS